VAKSYVGFLVQITVLSNARLHTQLHNSYLGTWNSCAHSQVILLTVKHNLRAFQQITTVCCSSTNTNMWSVTKLWHVQCTVPFLLYNTYNMWTSYSVHVISNRKPYSPQRQI